MKKGIKCNETRYVNGADRDRIRYEFVTEDGVTPSSCVVRLGDTDPRTGEKITDLTFFREYHRLVDHQVMKNNDAMRPGYTSAEKARRQRRKEAIIAAFAAEHGYMPSTSDVLWWLEGEEPERYNLPLDCLVDEEDGSDDLNRHAEFSIPFEEEESAELQALREYMESGQWKADFEADEAGQIPPGVKRGVLSEDGLYDLLLEAEKVKR